MIFADHQNKPDAGSAIASRWYDVDHVDAIVDVPVSSVALAVQEVARQRKRIVMFAAAGSSDLTGKACSPFGTQWAFDSVALAKGTASAVTKSGGDNWFFITADYAFGAAMEVGVRRALEAQGAFVRLKSPIPFDAPDGKPVAQVFVLLVPEHATEQHLQLLSELAQMFSEARFRESLGSPTDAAGLRAVFDRWEPSA